MADQPTVFTFRLELPTLRPKIWRCLEADGWLKFDCLHHIIQAAMGWRGGGFHEFRVGERVIARPGPEYSSFGVEVEDERKVRLDRVLSSQDTFLYFYIDALGDSWPHEVRVEGTEVRRGVPGYARVLEGERACPPAGMGGLAGYQQWRKHGRDHPDDPALQAALTTAGALGFHPETFDLWTTNGAISRMAANRWIGK